MNINVFKRKPTKLDGEIDRVLDWMKSEKPDSDEYTNMANNFKKLYEIKSINKNDRIKPDTIATVGCNLIGIWLILHYEEIDIITSKALGFVLKGRV